MTNAAKKNRFQPCGGRLVDGCIFLSHGFLPQSVKHVYKPLPFLYKNKIFNPSCERVQSYI